MGTTKIHANGSRFLDDEPDITIPEDQWRDSGAADADGSYLITTIWVNGCPLHLEAHAVDDSDDIQEDAGEESCFEKLNAAFDVEDRQQTVTIRGRQYVLFAHAYGG